MKLLYVEWEDAIAQSGWHTEEEIKEWAKNDNAIVEEVGWLYEETSTHIVLISRKIEEKQYDKNHVSYGLLQKIPKTWIRKKKVLKI